MRVLVSIGFEIGGGAGEALEREFQKPPTPHFAAIPVIHSTYQRSCITKSQLL
jgi:hypothetical protein